MTPRGLGSGMTSCGLLTTAFSVSLSGRCCTHRLAVPHRGIRTIERRCDVLLTELRQRGSGAVHDTLRSALCTAIFDTGTTDAQAEYSTSVIRTRHPQVGIDEGTGERSPPLKVQLDFVQPSNSDWSSQRAANYCMKARNVSRTSDQSPESG